jgi:hypothetical protein
MLDYLRALKPASMVLWCYLLWYLSTLWLYFDPAPALWLNSLGISALIGSGLLLSVGQRPSRANAWQTLRLYLMPFGVSSFAALIKGKGFYLIVPPHLSEALLCLGSCLGFVSLTLLLQTFGRPLKNVASDG